MIMAIKTIPIVSIDFTPSAPHKTGCLTPYSLAVRHCRSAQQACDHANVRLHRFAKIALPLSALRRRIKAAHEDEDHRVSFRAFPHMLGRQIILHMALQNSVRDTFTLSGDDENRLVQLLELARQQARVAQTAAAPRMQDALTDIEDALAGHLAALANAEEDDRADAEASGDPGRSWRPLRAA